MDLVAECCDAGGVTLYEAAVEYVRRLRAAHRKKGAAKLLGVPPHHVDIFLGESKTQERRYVNIENLDHAAAERGTADLLRDLLFIVEEAEGKKPRRRKAVAVPDAAGYGDEGTARELGLPAAAKPSGRPRKSRGERPAAAPSSPPGSPGSPQK